MRVIEDLAVLQGKYKNVVLTLGNFDGIHLGHQAILERVVAQANELNTPSVVFTFQEHPLKILTGGGAPPLLTTLKEKLSILEGLGIEAVVCIPFTREIASISANKFIGDICALLSPSWIMVGHDYAFGKNRSGNIELLKQKAHEYGYQVKLIEAIEVMGMTVSSTAIRQKISQGEVQTATRLFGRPYSLRSKVIAGQQKGKALSCDTANIAVQPKLLPACGVYAVKVELEGAIYDGVANIGYQPTYGQNDLQLEVHLLDFNADLYGRDLTVTFIARLREERKFPSVDALKQQISQDISQAREVLAKVGR